MRVKNVVLPREWEGIVVSFWSHHTNVVCHDSNVFLIRKLPLTIKEALLKSIECSWDHAWFAILEPLAAVLITTLIYIFTTILQNAK